MMNAMPDSRAFKNDGWRPRVAKKAESDRQEDGRTGNRWIRCMACGHKITRETDRITVNGSHTHVFNNPAGFIFEIGCFGRAEGASMRGGPTLEFTWFSGYSWRFALCGACETHLGWGYQALSGHGFFGLILTALAGGAS